MRARHVSKAAMFLPGCGLTGWGWSGLGEPIHLYGLIIAAVLGFLSWPLVVLALVFGLPAVLMRATCPRRLRKWYRHRYGRAGARSAYMPAWFRYVILFADNWTCVYCGTTRGQMHIDHFMPWCLGSITCLWNCLTLCRSCNLAKSNYWEFGGRPWAGSSRNPEKAGRILAAERVRRRSVCRWLRAAWALAA